MVSAPSVRRKRREAKRAEKREAFVARGGWKRSPLLLGLIALAVLVGVVGAVLAVQRLLTDPWQRGQAAMAAGDYRSARVDLLNAVEQQPRALRRRVLLAETLGALGRGREAENQLRRAVELGAPAERVRARLAHSLALQGRDAEALGELAEGPVATEEAALAARVAGEANYRLGRFDAAQRGFNDAVRIAPNDAMNWIAYSAWRLSEQDMLGADSAADQARRLAPDSIRARTAKAMVVRTRGGPVAALPWFEHALEVDGSDVAALAEYAATLGEAGRYRAMLEPLRRAAAIAPDNSRVLFLEATIAARGGEPALARGLLTRVRGRDNDLPAVLLLRTSVELMLNSPVAASEYAERLVAQQPDNQTARRLLAAAQMQADNPRGAILSLDPITTRPDADSWSLLLLGRAFGAIGWQTDAVQPLDRAATLRRGDARSLASPAEAANSTDPGVAVPAIRARIAAGDTAGARVLADQLAQRNPGVPQAWLLVGDAHWAADDGPGAVAAFRRAAELRYDEPTMLRLVNSLLKTGDRSQAGQALADFVARYPENVSAMRIAAAYAAEAGDWSGALAWQQAAIGRIGTNDALLLIQTARSLIEIGDADGAVSYAERAYRLLPGNATTSGVYGRALHLSGATGPAARQLLEKAVELAPNDALLRRWLSEIRPRSRR
jgi:cellulose synthase operon protein C